jgi:Excalibur calcium-binding domain
MNDSLPKPVLFNIALMLAALFPAAVFAHGGGLNSEGCHNDRKNGGYHCHRAPAPKVQTLFTDPNVSSRAFRNCAAARAAGAAPVRIGNPGYGAHLDRDGDGIGCE